MRRLYCAGMLLMCAACNETVAAPEAPPEQVVVVALGEAGESCTSRRDCSEGLACIDNRCVEPSAGPNATISPSVDGGTPTRVTDTRGGPGESCTRRADCRNGHSCIGNVCLEEGAVPEGMQTSPLGARGESCQARNDCEPDLACITQRCAESDFEFAVSTKQCFRVQCDNDEDCCENFVASVSCPTFQMQCDMGDTASCNAFDAQCVCRFSCEAELCAVVSRCSMDADCGSVALRCFSGRCAQCMVSDDCPGDDEQCVANVCRAGCERNEQCPLSHECREGECIEVGCSSDRECYFATSNPLSECGEDGNCITPCQKDAECGDFHVCEDSTCTFIGCDTDEECRVRLGLANQPGSDRAVCREPDR